MLVSFTNFLSTTLYLPLSVIIYFSLFEDNNLSDEVMARQLHLTISETEDILFCRISKFTLDYLMNVASKLFSPTEINEYIH